MIPKYCKIMSGTHVLIYICIIPTKYSLSIFATTTKLSDAKKQFYNSLCIIFDIFCRRYLKIKKKF